MAPPRKGHVRWVPARPGEAQGHYQARVREPSGLRPYYSFAPSPRSPEAEQRARELAAATTEQAWAAAGLTPTSRKRAQAPRAGESVSDWFERWVEDRETRGIATTLDDRSRYREHVKAKIGNRPLARVSRGELESIVERLDDRVRAGELSWHTAWRVWGLVTKMFADACAHKRRDLRARDDNPALLVRGPDRGVSKAKAYVHPDEFCALVACKDVPLAWRRVFALSVYLVTRAGELDALSWNDLDVERGIVHVHCATDRVRGSTKPTKTGKARRFSIEAELLPLLRAMHAAAGGKGKVAPPVSWPNGAMTLRAALKAAGITRAELHHGDATRKQLTFHDLRATGLTWMAIRGDDALKIMQRAGHANFSTTQLYVRDAEAIREGFGEVFPPLPQSLVTGIDEPGLGQSIGLRIGLSAGFSTPRKGARGELTTRNGSRNDSRRGRDSNPRMTVLQTVA